MSVNGAIVGITEVELDWLRSHDASDHDDEEQDMTDEWFWSDNPRSCELEKAYAGVHFLLTGENHGGSGPLSFIANEDLGEPLRYAFAYGPGRAFDPSAVR